MELRYWIVDANSDDPEHGYRHIASVTTQITEYLAANFGGNTFE